MLELISIHQAAQQLNYKDLRPTKVWISQRGIPMFKVGKGFCLLKEDFENAYYFPIISFLKYKQSVASQKQSANEHEISSQTIWTNYAEELSSCTMRASNEPLFLKKDLRVKGLTVFCSHCQRNVTDFCTEGGKLQQCEYGRTHKFKGYSYVPGTKIRKVKIYDTDDPYEAARLHILFDQLVKKGRYEDVGKMINRKETIGKTNPQFIEKAMESYLKVLKGESEYEFSQQAKSPAHIKDTDRTFSYFKEALRKINMNPETTMAGEVNDRVVNVFHNYLVKERGFANNTYNRHMTTMRTLFNHLKKQEIWNGKNPFVEVKKKKVTPEVNIVEVNKLLLMIDSMSPENAIQILGTGEKKNHWHSFLKQTFLLALMTGLRRESLISLKYSDIQENENGIPSVIQSSNLKVNRIKGYEKENEVQQYIPVTPQLRSLLSEQLDYDNNRKSEKFLVAGESTIQRKTLMNILSRSFTHFWKQKYPNEDIQFSDLRKTYISRLTLAVGSNSRILTGHASQDILEKHYIRKQMIAEAISNTEIFPELDVKKLERTNELEQVRENKKEQTKTIER
ncbi:MAG: tyrosine-type recombinase/integrase [Bacteroidetes bacterium]|nr:tyrosine-type recombinase/integrase [Bacteroidota bacterium]